MSFAARRLFLTWSPAMALALSLIASCANDAPPNAGSGGGADVLGNCATPQEGCPCDTPGKEVDCGKVESRSGDYVLCSNGKRTCQAGAWGACSSEWLTTKHVSVGTRGVGPQGLGVPATCPVAGPLSDPCDPYCNQTTDNPIDLEPDGGLTVIDGGLTIANNAGDASAPGAFLSTPGGVTSCAGANNIVATGSCSAAPLVLCQQDFHCDPTVDRCLWNGGLGYFDPDASGPDLTVGSPCGSGTTASVPVCNRGTTEIPSGQNIVLQRTNGVSPPDGCAPIASPLDTWTFTLAGPLVPGACLIFDVPNSATGNQFITVNAGVGGAPVTEGPDRCANNSAAWKTDGEPGCAACTTCNTQVTGTVFDPSGASPTANANNIGLSNVLVFQPSASLTPFTDGVACDSCASLSTPSQTQTVTATDGTFTLDNVSPGTSVPIVVQSGRWRRTVNVNVSNVCGVNPVTNGTLRMPRNSSEGDIPKVAIVKTHKESMECWLKKIGVDPAEITPRTVAGPNTTRFQTWDAKSNGILQAGGMTPESMRVSATNGLYNTDATLNEYNAIIWGCDNNANNTGGPGTPPFPNSWTDSDRASAADRARIAAWANAGGRIFMNHRVGVNLMRGVPGFDAAVNWVGAPCNELYSCGSNQANPRNNYLRGWVVDTPGPQAAFRDWLIYNGASATQGAGFLAVPEAWAMAFSANAPAIEWVRGTNVPSGAGPGHHNLTLSFETPFGATNTCGRVIYNGLHTSADRATNLTGTFPTDCRDSALNDAELALEYQFFQLTACSITPPDPPPPPPPPPLAVVHYTRDYEGVCPAGSMPEWRYFFWQADIPSGTSIEFYAATADDPSLLPEGPPTSPSTVRIGTASATTPSGTFDFDSGPPPAGTVGYHLLHDTPGPQTSSKQFLRVYMVFRPVGQTAPTLWQWSQQFSCIPNE